MMLMIATSLWPAAFSSLPTCVYVSGSAKGSATQLMGKLILNEDECANEVVALFNTTANGVIHDATQSLCFAVEGMFAIHADPAQRQRSCFLSPSSKLDVCSVAPAACEANRPPYGSPFEGSTLSLRGRSLGGFIPTELGLRASTLETLDFAHNKLSGTMPSQLGMLTNLVSLQLDHNLLSGEVPSELGRLTKLTDELALHRNSLRGRLPSQLGHLSPALCYLTGMQAANGIMTPEEANSFECPLPKLSASCGMNGVAFVGRDAHHRALCAEAANVPSEFVSHVIESV